MQTGYDGRSFDAYYSAFVGVQRRDDDLSTAVGVLYARAIWASL